MANWLNPVVTSTYLDVLADLKARDVDAATMLGTGSNLPVGLMHWSRQNKAFYEWNGSGWVVQVIGALGGGTGGVVYGTMAQQNADNVAITGGGAGMAYLTINGVFIAQPSIGIQMHNHISFVSDGAYAIGSNGARCHTIYIRHGLVLPVGVNKYVVG